MLASPLDPALSTAALNAIPFGILIIDADGAMVWENSRATVLTGYSLEELGGQPLGLLVPAVMDGRLGVILAQVIAT